MPEPETTPEETTPTPDNDSLLDGSTGEAAPAPDATDDAGWQLADGVAGEGDRPDWLSAKYTTAMDQAKAYSELEGKLGGFTGAPEGDYAFNMPEGVSGEVLEGSPLKEAIDKVCQEAGVNQGFYDQLVGAYATQMAVDTGISKQDQMAALGAEGPQMIKDLQDWGQANLDESEYATLQALCTTADAVNFLSVLKNKFSSSTAVPTNEVPATGDSLDEARLHALLADERWAKDPIYQEEVMRKFKKFYPDKG